MIASKNESDVGRDLIITQKDITEIIKAKAAIHAAIVLLLNHLKLKESSIDRILLAGAFGSYIDPENARIIGMLPDIEIERIMQIGNAAGSGAKAVLLNRDERLKAEEISAKATFIELATHPLFFKEYVNSMYLPYKNPERYPRTMAVLKKIRANPAFSYIDAPHGIWRLPRRNALSTK